MSSIWDKKNREGSSGSEDFLKKKNSIPRVCSKKKKESEGELKNRARMYWSSSGYRQ